MLQRGCVRAMSSMHTAVGRPNVFDGALRN